MRLGWPKLVALALLLTLVAPAASAQSGTIRVTLAPASLATDAGVEANTTVTVTNDGIAPLLVSLAAMNATGGLVVAFDKTDLDVLPGSSESTTARVTSNQTGAWSVTIRARERTGLGANESQFGDALLQVTVRVPPPNGTGNNTNGSNNDTPTPPPDEGGGANETPPSPPPPLVVNATEIVLHATRGGSASLRLEIHNPASVAQTVDLTMRLPLGWAGTLDAARFTIPANASLVARGSVTPTAQAHPDEGDLEVRAASGVKLVRLRLLIDEPASSVGDGSVVDDQPPSQHVIPGEEGATAPTGPTPPPPVVHARPTLRVEPREVGAAPGTSVVFTLHIANEGNAALTGRARVDAPPLDVSISEPTFTAPPSDGALVTFVVRVPDDIVLGTSYEGMASIAFDVDPAIFVVHVESGEPMLLAQAIREPGAPLWLAWALAGAGALAVAGAAAARRWPLLGLAPLYARLAPRRALEHPRRAAMLALLQEEPGLTLADVQRRLGFSNGVARHHLALLEAAGALRSVADGSLRRLWPVGAAKAEAVPALRERALALLASRGRMRATDLAAELGVSRQLLHYHVRKLEAEGRIVAKRVQQEIVLETR